MNSPNNSSEVEIFKHYYDNPKDKNGNDKPNESLGIFTILDGQTKGEIMNDYSFSFYGKQDNGIYRVQGREVSGMYGNPDAGTICSTEKIEWITDLLHQSEIKGRIDEHSVINMRYPTAKRDPKNVLKVEGYTIARNEFDRISFNRIKELNQMKGKE